MRYEGTVTLEASYIRARSANSEAESRTWTASAVC